jgi:hypothetical protein
MKNILKKLLFASCVALLSTSAIAAAPVAKIQNMLAKQKILCGRFDQSKTLVGFKKPLASNGRFCVVNGKGVLWRTLQPFPDTLKLTRDEIVHMQGDRVSMRLDAKQEPTVRMINSVLFSLLAGDLTQLENLFEMDGNIRDNGWHVALKARDPALAKAIGSIALEGGAYVKNITITEASGDRTNIVFSGYQTGDTAMNADEVGLF